MTKTFEEFLQERYDLWKYRSETNGKIESNKDLENFSRKQEIAKAIFEEIKLISNELNPEIHISSIEKNWNKRVVSAEVPVIKEVIDRFALGELTVGEET